MGSNGILEDVFSFEMGLFSTSMIMEGRFKTWTHHSQKLTASLPLKIGRTPLARKGTVVSQLSIFSGALAVNC